MERIELIAQAAIDGMPPLSVDDTIQNPLSCCAALSDIAAAATLGGLAGIAVCYFQCHNHGCVHDSPEAAELTEDLSGMSVGDMLNVRTRAATARR
jgi:hypothetical protein